MQTKAPTERPTPPKPAVTSRRHSIIGTLAILTMFLLGIGAATLTVMRGVGLGPFASDSAHGIPSITVGAFSEAAQQRCQESARTLLPLPSRLTSPRRMAEAVDSRVQAHRELADDLAELSGRYGTTSDRSTGGSRSGIRDRA